MIEFESGLTLVAIGVFAVTGVLAGLRADANVFSWMEIITRIGGGKA